MMKKLLFLIPVISFLIIGRSYSQQTMGHPAHIFFEYGPLSKISDASEIKNGSHFAAGFKKHSWIEDRPIQFEVDIDYRSISFYDSLETLHKCGMGEIYLGPRLQISKTSPFYPTASILGGGYLNFNGNADGLGALATIGFYYNFTEPGTPRNGCTVELTYHTAKINFQGYTIPPAFALRIGFFF